MLRGTRNCLPSTYNVSIYLADRSKFNFRLHDLDWREYIFNYYLAVRTHLLKNAPETVARSRRRLNAKVRMYNLARGAVVAAAVSVCAAWRFGLF